MAEEASETKPQGLRKLCGKNRATASGYDLRRPAADYLTDGIYFSGQNVAILVHSITKEEEAVPAVDIEWALRRKRLFAENSEAHTYVEEEDNEGEEDGEDK